MTRTNRSFPARIALAALAASTLGACAHEPSFAPYETLGASTRSNVAAMAVRDPSIPNEVPVTYAAARVSHGLARHDSGEPMPIDTLSAAGGAGG